MPGYAVLRRFEPRLQGVHQRLRLGLPDRAALIGVETPDPLLDRVDGRNALDDLLGEGRVRRLVDFDEVPTRVNETKRQADFPRSLLVARQRGIGGITVGCGANVVGRAIRGLEVGTGHAASTAFRISEAVLFLT